MDRKSRWVMYFSNVRYISCGEVNVNRYAQIITFLIYIKLYFHTFIDKYKFFSPFLERESKIMIPFYLIVVSSFSSKQIINELL